MIKDNKYKITNTLLNSQHKRIYQCKSRLDNSNYIYIEIDKNIKTIRNIDDIYYKLLIPVGIFNPKLIINFYLIDDNKIGFIMPFDYNYNQKEVPKYFELKKTINITENSFHIINGEKGSGKTFIISLLKIYYQIKKYTILDLSIIQSFNTDKLLLEILFNKLNIEFNKNKIINIYLHQKEIENEITNKLKNIINKNKTFIIIDNFDICSYKVKKNILSIFSNIVKSQLSNNFLIFLSTSNYLNEDLLSIINKKNLINIELTKNLIQDKLNSYNNLLANSFYTLNVLNKNNIDSSDDINKEVKRILNSLSSYQTLILNILILSEYPIKISMLKNIFLNYCKDLEYKEDILLKELYMVHNLAYIDIVIVNEEMYFVFPFKYLFYNTKYKFNKSELYLIIAEYYKKYTIEPKPVLYYSILANNKKLSHDFLHKLIYTYSQNYNFETILYFIEKFLHKFELSNIEYYTILKRKADIQVKARLWYKAIDTIDFILKSFKKNEDIDSIYYLYGLANFYICNYSVSYHYLIKCNKISKNNKQQILSLLKISMILIHENHTSIANKYINKINKSIKESNYDIETKEHLYLKTNIINFYLFISEKKLQKGQDLILNSLSNAKFLNSKIHIEFLIELAYLFCIKKDYSKSFNYLAKSYNIASNINDKKFLSDIYFILGLNFSNMKNNKKSIEYLNLALKIKESIHESYYVGIINYKISEYYVNINKFEIAEKYNRKALLIFKKNNIQHYYTYSLMLNAEILIHKRNFNQAVYLYKSIMKKNKRKSFFYKESLNQITKIYNRLIKYTGILKNFIDNQDFEQIDKIFRSKSMIDADFFVIYKNFEDQFEYIINNNTGLNKNYNKLLNLLLDFSLSEQAFIFNIEQDNPMLYEKVSRAYSSKTDKYKINKIIQNHDSSKDNIYYINIDNYYYLYIPLISVSTMDSNRLKEENLHLRKNKIGFIVLESDYLFHKDTVNVINAKYDLINIELTKALQYKLFNFHDGQNIIKKRFFKNQVFTEIKNCIFDNIPFGFLYIELDSNDNCFDNFLTYISKNIFKHYRMSDLITKYSNKEILIFLPLAKKEGKEGIERKTNELIKKFPEYKNHNNKFYTSYIFFNPLADGQPEIFFDNNQHIRLKYSLLLSFLQKEKELII